MNFVISQLAGLLSTGAAAISFQCKNAGKMLLWQFAGNGLGAVNYILLGGLSGCGAYIIGLAQTAILYMLRRKNRKPKIWLISLFVLSQMLCALVTYKSPIDCMPIAAAIIAALALSQENMFKFRVLAFFNGALWIAYDIYVGAYAMLLNHIFTCASSIIGIVRNDINRKRAE